MSNPFKVVRDFEAALCDFTGAPFAVSTTSCTMALLLAVAWHLRDDLEMLQYGLQGGGAEWIRKSIEIPKRTYVGVPMSIIHAGGRPTFRDENWTGAYELSPLKVWDSARWFSAGMYRGDFAGPFVEGNVRYTFERDCAGQMVCVSFHWSKTLGIQQGGAILHDDPEADRWLRMARFDGREEGVAPKDQKEWIVGWHCYMAPATAAEGLTRLRLIPRHNDPLPNDDYPDLSTMDIFR